MHDLRLLAALAEDRGAVPCRLPGLAARAGVPDRSAYNAARRLTAAGWITPVPAGTGEDNSPPWFLIAPGRQARAREALDTARAGIALARYALTPGAGPVPVPAFILAAAPALTAALITRAFLDSLAQPCTYRALEALSGISEQALRRALLPMTGAGLVADVTAPAGANGRPPRQLVLTPAGLAAAPAVLAAAHGQLTDTARSLLPATAGPAGPAVPHRAVSRLLAAELARSPWEDEPPALYVIQAQDGACRLRRISLPHRSWHGRRPQDVIARLSVPSARQARAEPASSLLGVAVHLPAAGPHRENTFAGQPPNARSRIPAPVSGEAHSEEVRIMHGVDTAGTNYAFTQRKGSAEVADRSRSLQGGVPAALRLLLDAMAAARRNPPVSGAPGRER